MKKKMYLILTLVLIIIIATSCNNKEKIVEQNKEPLEEPKNVEEPVQEEPEENPEEIDPKEENMKTIEALKDKGYRQSKLDGVYIKEDLFNLRPVTVMYDNHPYARWQAGLILADIVYECEVEFPFTRYMAVFQEKEVEHIGPVRSARPYYLRYALEYDSVYVHVGGSNDAMAKIQDYYMADVDGLYSGNFWRYNETGKSIPNNMYTDMKNIREAQNSYGYRSNGNFEGYNFHELMESIDEKLKPEKCTEMNIIFNQHYEIDFIYNEENDSYTRFVNGEKHVDEYYDDEIEAVNIIVLKTTKTVLDDVGRLSINTVGEGTGTYISRGLKIDITWEKNNYNAKTFFYDKNGEEVVFNPGQTWIEVTTQGTNINYEEE